MNSLLDTEADPTSEISSTLFHMAGVHGWCDDRFAAIKALAEELAAEDDDGFALAVEVDGELVVDLWAGRASAASLIHTFLDGQTRLRLCAPAAGGAEHAFTYGHLIGELVRRISGQSIGSFIRSEISEAHDIDVHIGLGSEELGQVTDIATDPDFWSSIGWTSREARARARTRSRNRR